MGVSVENLIPIIFTKFCFSVQLVVMSLPVSQYEALLAEVRGLRRKAQRVQQLAKPLLQGDSSTYGVFASTDAIYQVSIHTDEF